MAEIAQCWECRTGPTGRAGCKHVSSFQGARPAGCKTFSQCFWSCNPEQPHDQFLVPTYNPFDEDLVEVEKLLSQKYKQEEGSKKVIKNLNIDFSDIKAGGEVRGFTITGDKNAEFELEIKNEDSHYYNFVTRTFSSTRASLNKVMRDGVWKGSVSFPKITDNDQYDIYLFAKPGTKHADHVESRFEDGSLDLNKSIGSRSSLMQKVIYQYTDLTLTLSTFSPSDTVETGSQSNATITTSRNKAKSSIAFSVACSVSTAAKSYQIIKQPLEDYMLAYDSITVGSAPENLPGEDIYPAATTTGAINGDFTTGTNKIIIDGTGIDPLPKVGDQVFPAASTGNKTVDGAVTSGVKVVMDDNVNTIMAVGDRITSYAGGHALDSKNVTVAALNPDGDNVKEFSMSEAVALADGLALSFNPAVNSTIVTVTAVNPDGDNANEFQISTTTGFRDNQDIQFRSAKNFQWPVNDISKLKSGAKVLPGTNVTSETSVAKYKDTVTIFENTERERKIIKNKADALRTKGQKPTITGGLVTTQPGNVVFDKQQVYALAGDTIKVGAYGLEGVLNVYGYEIKITDLTIELTTVTTTTTTAVNNSTSVPVASRNGMLDSVSTISGIGIDPSVADPTISSGAGSVSGAGTIVLSAAQTLESGTTLTVGNSGQTITITGNVEIVKSGTENKTIYFDVDKLLSIT